MDKRVRDGSFVLRSKKVGRFGDGGCRSRFLLLLLLRKNKGA